MRGYNTFRNINLPNFKVSSVYPKIAPNQTFENLYVGDLNVTGSATGPFSGGGGSGGSGTGPQGPQGPQGLQGIPGSASNTGATGIQGRVGPQGSQGLQGNIGPSGVQGIMGPSGAQGNIGQTGIIGPQGFQGIPGIASNTGATGVQGNVGPQGLIGVTGIQGNIGPTGIQGNIGPQGPQGLIGITGIQGNIGPIGIQGFQGGVGSVGPQGLQGNVGQAGFASGLIPNLDGVIPTMTQNIQYGYVISSSSEFNTSFAPWKPLGNPNADWATLGNSLPIWWQVQLPNPLVIYQFQINRRSSNEYFQNFTFQGSNDGLNWTILKTITGELTNFPYPSVLTVNVFDPSYTPYIFYRVQASTVVGTNVGFNYFQLYAYQSVSKTSTGAAGPIGPQGPAGGPIGPVGPTGSTGPIGPAGFAQALVPRPGGYIPYLTSNSSQGFTVSASTEFNASFAAWQPLGLPASDYAAANAIVPMWWKIQCPSPQIVYQFQINRRSGGPYFQNFTFQGSNDDNNWNILATVQGGLDTIAYPDLLTVSVVDLTFTAYTFFRLYVTQVSGVTPGMHNFQMFVYNTTPTYFTGPIGPTGPSGGPIGPQGFQGIPGFATNFGATGPTGLRGFQGFQGISGFSTNTGATGPVGFQGSQGFQGLPGTASNTGAQGPQGPQGISYWTLSSTNIYNNNAGNVGIGTTTPAYKLDVVGISNATNIRATTQFLGNPSDSATTPSYSFDTDTNCGIFHAGTDSIGFTTSGVERMRILAAGNVGIATTTPAYPLDVNGTSNATNVRATTQHLGNTADTASAPSYSWDTDTTVGMFHAGTNALGFSTNSSERIRILAAGNVGIATTTPAYPLDVNGIANATNVRATTQHLGNTADTATTPSYSFDGDTQVGMYNITTNTLGFSTSGIERMRILAGGNIGINQPSPTTTLDVGGTITTQFTSLGSNSSYQYYGKANINDSASTPSYSFNGSVTSGMFTPGLNTIAFSTNGTERMRMLAAGNIGIATITPSYILDVNGTANATNVRATTQHLGNTADTAITPSYSWDTDTNCGMYNITTNTLGFSTSSTERLRISAGGLVGINQTSPATVLDVGGTITTQFTQLGNNSSYQYYGKSLSFDSASIPSYSFNGSVTSGMFTPALNTIAFTTNGSERMRMLAGGNIGIATTTPGYTLDVNGTANATNVRATTQHLGNTADTATTPSYSFDGDVNCGMYNITTNTLGFSTSGIERMRISAAGNIGINQISPATVLDVGGTITTQFTQLGNNSSYQYYGKSLTFDSASTPSYSFNGSVTSGMFTPALNTIAFSTNGSERMRMLAAGNIGIATTTPGYTLDVNGTANATNVRATTQHLGNTADTATTPSYSFDGDTQVGMFNAGTNILGFTTSGIERMRILAAGNIGIGTTTPGYPLDVNGTSNATNVRATTQHLGNTADTASVPSYSFDGDTDTGMFNVSANILGFSTNATERMRINGSGNVGIGLAGSDPSFVLQVGSDQVAKPTSGTWLSSSDKRIKYDIQNQDLQSSYNIITNLQLKNFKYDSSILPESKDKTFVGFIAQEVEEILPNSVTKTNQYNLEDFRSLDIDQIYKHLIGTVQFLMKKVEQLESEVNQLKNKN